MKAKDSDPPQKFSHPISVYSNNPSFVSSISSNKNRLTAELPAKALLVQIDQETFDEIKYFWENYCAAILKYTGGEIIEGNLVIKAKCSVDCEECF